MGIVHSLGGIFFLKILRGGTLPIFNGKTWLSKLPF